MSQSTPPSDFHSDLGSRLRAHVELLAGVIGPRNLSRPTSMEAAVAYISRQMERFGDGVRREAYTVGDHSVSNIVMERAGSSRPSEIVLLGAHYDTCDQTPGADDNASAVAALLEVLRLLAGVQTPRSIRFVSFACEEPPHFYTDSMGSQVHARACRSRSERLTAMVCLEMLGYYTDSAGSQRVPEGVPRWLSWLFPKRGNFLASVGNLRSLNMVYRFDRGFRAASKLPLFSVSLPERIGAIRLSDNSSFWDQGYPALMLTDTSFYRNPNYHLPSDTPDTLDYRRLSDAVIGIVGGVAQLAGFKGRIPALPNKE